ncbi:hypothetical protein ACJRO7_005972 [Eucalyptus globulus]|uniref:Uncharacterized protein n=1 Tax=Eucalyptus globulus TaxID=34317 RepID=A0ABD3J8V4_EUCGL
MGKKNLPDPTKRSLPYLRFAEMVTTNIDDVKSALKAGALPSLSLYLSLIQQHNRTCLLQRSTTLARGDTATRLWPEHVGRGRVGRGGVVYRIVRHKPSGKRAPTHLIYRLEFPPEEEKQEPQESPNVRREGSFLIQIKNPEQQHGKRKAVFPAHLHLHLQGQFSSVS